jgi:hypothetical protein
MVGRRTLRLKGRDSARARRQARRVNVATDIVGALAPGVALTSGIFYANGLHVRLNVLTARVRDLNREARLLGADELQRRASIRRQVDLFLRRVRIVQRAVVASYVGLVLYIGTILLLLAVGIVEPGVDLAPVADALFGAGLLAVACAIVLSIVEMDLSNRTLAEDIATSFTPDP